MDTWVKPVRGVNLTASEEATQLEKNLQRQLEEDVASDAYTECNINHQEKEILEYLNENLIVNLKTCPKSQIIYKNETYSTPRSLSAERELSLNSLSPSTEITKEYYALVTIDGHFLDQELQPPLNKPTTLSLATSHTFDIVKHTNSCNTLVSVYNVDTSHNDSARGKVFRYGDKTVTEPIYTPDSLITDDPSSSSDYVSATYSWPHEINTYVPHITGNNKMDSNINNLSDSGLENSILETQNSHPDVTPSNKSLNTVHELTACFINAADLMDEDDTPLNAAAEEKNLKYSPKSHLDEDVPSGEDNLPDLVQSKEVSLAAATDIAITENNDLPAKPNSAWVIDMSIPLKTEGENISASKNSLLSESFLNFENHIESRGSVDSDNSGKTSQKFFVDLAGLPDLPQEKNKAPENASEKKMFSLYIDLDKNSSLKKMPARLTSLLTSKKPEINTNSKMKPKVSKVENLWDVRLIPQTVDRENIATFENVEALCDDQNMNITEIIGRPNYTATSKCKDLEMDITRTIGSPTLGSTQKCKETGLDRDIKENFEKPKSTSTPKRKENNPDTCATRIIDCQEFVFAQKYKESNHDMGITKIVDRPKYTRSSESDETNSDKEFEHTILEAEEPLDTKKTNIVEDSNNKPAELFVKLSDLDKPAVKTDVSSLDLSDNHDIMDVRMTLSIPENSWGASKPSTSCFSDIMTSFHSENAISLNRLFPHLKNEFSKSMPLSLSCKTQLSLSTRPSSSSDQDDQALDLSERNCALNCLCRFDPDNNATEEINQAASLIASCQSRLGQDLLRMFVDEIAPDVIVEVSGKRIKAHKCILSSRCQYFARILSGDCVESAGNVIVLPQFSPNVAHFALCHIYSGVSVVPESVCIVELTTIADMLCLEGLKEAVMFSLQSKYCHHFHKPCQVCIIGVHECFIMTWVYGLDDLFRKCLKWIITYYTELWPTKAFATLPTDLMERCYKEHVNSITLETFLDWVYGFGVTLSLLPTSRWAENVEVFGKRLLNAAACFASDRLVKIFKEILFVSADAPWPARHALEDCITNAIDWAPCEETCQAYSYLYDHVKTLRQNTFNHTGIQNNNNIFLFTHANNWRLQCEEALIRSPYIFTTQVFKDLPEELRKRLRELGCINLYDHRINKLVVKQKKNKQRKSKSLNTSRNMDMDQVRAIFVPYASTPTAKTKTEIRSSNDINEAKKRGTQPPLVRTTKAQEKRAMYNMMKRNQSQEQIRNKTVKTLRQGHQNIRSQHTEARPNVYNETNRSRHNRIMSSSESSRNTSPPQVISNRASRSKSKLVRTQAMSQDSLTTTSRPRTTEPSTESLSESQPSTSNKYATYTKMVHGKKGPTGYIKTDGIKQTCERNIKSFKTLIPVSQPQKYKLKKPSAVDAGTTKPLLVTTQAERKLPGLLMNSTPKRSLTTQAERKLPCSLVNATAKHSLTTTQAERKLPNSLMNANAKPSSTAKQAEYKLPNSLMNATKASQAKMVAKIVKEPKGAVPKGTKPVAKQPARRAPAPPPLQRFSTFLKDEPSCSAPKKPDNPEE